jgi:peptidyl-dipeptidase Dcp
MSYHTVDPSSVTDVVSFEAKATDKASLFPKVPGTLISTSFSHIFAGGYSAGYYSYKWAEVLDADAFEFFQTSGIFDKNVAKKFREFILEKGGTEHPMELYKRFRGQEPNVNALLKRAGLH